tara:strand:+ start:2999 stop:3397 length:399 start_codon:yes stop_codon:yes gene_type:complete
MNKFFVSNEVYNERIAICKSCVYYFSPTGQCKRCLCFMKIKSRISSQSCPEKFWEQTSEIETPDDLPQEIIEEVLKVWEDIKSGRAKNQAAKKRMIELCNTIYNTSYSEKTNCGTCLSSCRDSINKLQKIYR